MNNDQKNSKAVTTKWHWIVCFAVTFAIFLDASVPHSFYAFINYFTDKRGHDRMALLYMIIIAFSSPHVFLIVSITCIRLMNKPYRIVGFLCFFSIAASSFLSINVHNYHENWLFLTFTPSYFAGSSVLSGICVVILSEYFPISHPHHILATSFYQIAYPAAPAVFIPSIYKLLELFPWQTVLMMIASLQLILGTGIILLFKPYKHQQEITNEKPVMVNIKTAPEVNEEEEGKCKKMLHMMVCCTKNEFSSNLQMLPWFMAKFLTYTCWLIMRPGLGAFLRDRGHTITEIRDIVACFTCGEIGLCIVAAILSRHLRGKLLLVHFCGSFYLGMLLILWTALPETFLHSTYTDHIFSLLVGIGLQVCVSFGYPASAEILGLEMAKAWATTSLFAGLGVLCSPILTEKVIGLRAHFYFRFSSGLWLFQSFLHFIIWLIMRRK